MKHFLWLQTPEILSTTGSGLRVEDGRARVHVVVRGHGWLRCETASLFVTGEAQVTFAVDAQTRKALVTFRGLFGTDRSEVDIPSGQALSITHAPVVVLTAEPINTASLRPVPSTLLRPRPASGAALRLAHKPSSPGPYLERAQLKPPRSTQDNRT